MMHDLFRSTYKKRRYGGNVSETTLHPQIGTRYETRGLHRAFNKGGIPLLMMSSRMPHLTKRVHVK